MTSSQQSDPQTDTNPLHYTLEVERWVGVLQQMSPTVREGSIKGWKAWGSLEMVAAIDEFRRREDAALQQAAQDRKRTLARPYPRREEDREYEDDVRVLVDRGHLLNHSRPVEEYSDEQLVDLCRLVLTAVEHCPELYGALWMSTQDLLRSHDLDDQREGLRLVIEFEAFRRPRKHQTLSSERATEDPHHESEGPKVDRVGEWMEAMLVDPAFAELPKGLRRKLKNRDRTSDPIYREIHDLSERPVEQLLDWIARTSLVIKRRTVKQRPGEDVYKRASRLIDEAEGLTSANPLKLASWLYEAKNLLNDLRKMEDASRDNAYSQEMRREIEAQRVEERAAEVQVRRLPPRPWRSREFSQMPPPPPSPSRRQAKGKKGGQTHASSPRRRSR